MFQVIHQCYHWSTFHSEETQETRVLLSVFSTTLFSPLWIQLFSNIYSSLLFLTFTFYSTVLRNGKQIRQLLQSCTQTKLLFWVLQQEAQTIQRLFTHMQQALVQFWQILQTDRAILYCPRFTLQKDQFHTEGSTQTSILLQKRAEMQYEIINSGSNVLGTAARFPH